MNKMTAISYVRNFALVSLASLALAGCFEQKPLEETKSVEFYSQNSADRAAMVKRCAGKKPPIASMQCRLRRPQQAAL